MQEMQPHVDSAQAGSSANMPKVQERGVAERKNEAKPGDRFGRLVVLRLAPCTQGDKSQRWECRCDCGRTTFSRKHTLLSGKTSSCGCQNYFKRYEVNDNFFDFIGEKQAWLLGMLAADGSISNDRTFSISQSNKHGLELINTIKEMIGFKGKVSHYKNAHSISLTSEKIAENLAKFNIIPRKSLVYEFPDQLPKDKYVPFLRGYFDGDGSCGIYDTGTTNVLCMSFVGTEKFIERCKEIIPIRYTSRKIESAQNLYEIRFYGKYALTFGVWLWGNKELPRYYKQDIYDSFLKNNEPLYIKYEKILVRVRGLLKKKIADKKIAELVGIPVSSIYQWRYKGKI